MDTQIDLGSKTSPTYPLHIFNSSGSFDQIKADLKADDKFPNRKPAVVIVSADYETAAEDVQIIEPAEHQWIEIFTNMGCAFGLSDSEIAALFSTYQAQLKSPWAERQIFWMSLLTTKRVKNAIKEVIKGGSLYDLEVAIPSQIDAVASRGQLPTNMKWVNELAQQWHNCVTNGRVLLVPSFVMGRDKAENERVVSAIDQLGEEVVRAFFRKSAIKAAVLSEAAMRKLNVRTTMPTCWPEDSKLLQEIVEMRRTLTSAQPS